MGGSAALFSAKNRFVGNRTPFGIEIIDVKSLPEAYYSKAYKYGKL